MSNKNDRRELDPYIIRFIVVVLLIIGVLVFSWFDSRGDGPNSVMLPIAATDDSIGERITKLEQEIETLKYDIEALRVQAAQTTYVFDELSVVLEERFKQGVEGNVSQR